MTLFTTIAGFAITAGQSKILTDFLSVNGHIQVMTVHNHLSWMKGLGIDLPCVSLALSALIAGPTKVETIDG
ncbi:MAG: hypothetical protein MK102_14145 [Fuerstiella sp.]|nr:hypothetical protein [Fuerstiella sp.]